VRCLAAGCAEGRGPDAKVSQLLWLGFTGTVSRLKTRVRTDALKRKLTAPNSKALLREPETLAYLCALARFRTLLR